MEKLVEIRGGRVLVEQSGFYKEKQIDTLENQAERIRKETLNKMMGIDNK